jgi:hypothetical protein
MDSKYTKCLPSLVIKEIQLKHLDLISPFRTAIIKDSVKQEHFYIVGGNSN